MAWLPINEIVSAIEFRFAPEHAKLSHFLKLTNLQGNQVYLVGTIHDNQFNSQTYPYWQLRSVIEKIQPIKILVEIRPESILANKWGEGPPEMPLVVAWSKEFEIPVDGMDFWKPNQNSQTDFIRREDQMFKNIVIESKGSKVTLIFTGYSHVVGVKRRLIDLGYKIDELFTNKEKIEIFEAKTNPTIPDAYFVAVLAAISEANEGHSDYPKEWAQRRQDLVEALLTQARADNKTAF